MQFNRENLRRLLTEIMNYKIERVIISHKDRLSRTGFDLFQDLFREFGMQIVIVNDLESVSTEQEIFQEIISLIHC
jgi:predicted site-specific integrase-resolvase